MNRNAIVMSVGALFCALGLSACSSGGGGSDASNLQHVFFTRYGVNDPHLYVMREDGAGMTPLDTTDNGGKIIRGIAGDRVVYELSPVGGSDIYSVKLDGTGRVPLAADAAAYEYTQHIGADGRVIYSKSGELFAVQADGTGLTTLASVTTGAYYEAALSDGRVVYSTSDLGVVREIMVVNADGTGTIRVTDGSAVDKYYQAATPYDRIIYSRITSTARYPNPCDLFIANADGTNTLPLTNDPATAKIFQGLSPDGKVLYTVYAQSGLFSVNFDGSGTLELTGSLTGRLTVNAFMAPTRVVFTRATGVTLDKFDLYAVNTDGTGNAVLAADGAVNEYFAAVTPAGRVVYTTGTTAFRGDIWSVNADGSGTVALAADPVVDELFHAVTPDDRVVYRRWGGGLYSALSDGSGTAVLDNDPTVSVWYGGDMTAQGRIIYMRSYEDPVTFNMVDNIAAVNADGSDRKDLTTIGDVNSVEYIY